MNIYIKRSILIFVAVFIASSSFAQVDQLKNTYQSLVNRYGFAGVGIETVLDQWEKEAPRDREMLFAKYNFFKTKAASSSVVKKETSKYLGMEPMLELKDSTGKSVYYYNEYNFDPEYLLKAIEYADRGVDLYSDDLFFRFLKINAYFDTEKGEPLNAPIYLNDLIDYNHKTKLRWSYFSEPVDDVFFNNAIQEFCQSYYSLGTPEAYEAFAEISNKMLSYNKKNTTFLNNMSAYYLVAKQDYKKARKYLKKVLKYEPLDEIALQNAMILARRTNDKKLQTKILEKIKIVNANKIQELTTAETTESGQ